LFSFLNEIFAGGNSRRVLETINGFYDTVFLLT